MLPGEMKNLARRFVDEAWGKGNLKVLNEFCAPEYTIGDNGTINDLKAGIKAIRKAVPDLRCGIREMIAEGDWVAYRWTLSGTHRGEYEGIAPTGKPVKFSGITMLRFSKGKIVEDIYEIGSREFKEQVGQPVMN